MAKLWSRRTDTVTSTDGFARYVSGTIPFVNPGQKLLRTIVQLNAIVLDVPTDRGLLYEIAPTVFYVMVTRGNPPLPPDIIHEQPEFSSLSDILHLEFGGASYVQYPPDPPVANRTVEIPGYSRFFHVDTSVERTCGPDEHLGIWPVVRLPTDGSGDYGEWTVNLLALTLREV